VREGSGGEKVFDCKGTEKEEIFHSELQQVPSLWQKQGLFKKVWDLPALFSSLGLER
jgi:hypothetical protein